VTPIARKESPLTLDGQSKTAAFQASGLDPRAINIAGLRFGRLTVIEPAGRRRGYITWRCLCDCGNEHIAIGSRLRSGECRSCGCHVKSALARSNPVEYQAWKRMRQLQPAVCRRWRESFDSFYGDMGTKPAGHRLARLDVRKPYQPNNCRWVEFRRQITFRRQTRNRSQWARILGVTSECLRQRLSSMPVELALSRGRSKPGPAWTNFVKRRREARKAERQAVRNGMRPASAGRPNPRLAAAAKCFQGDALTHDQRRERRARMVALAAQGSAPAEIACHFGVSVALVRIAVKQKSASERI
jgi:hypothetical protein